MAFIRPEAAATLTRWREVLIGAAIAGLGLYLLATTRGALFLIGAGAAIGGTALCVAGIQRLRFRQGAGGPGVVEVVEGQLSYFGPLDGGVLSVTEIERVELVHDGPTRLWVISHRDGPPLAIPTNAAGNEALFDVFSVLPGLIPGRALQALNRSREHRIVIWQRDVRRLDH